MFCQKVKFIDYILKNDIKANKNWNLVEQCPKVSWTQQFVQLFDAQKI